MLYNYLYMYRMKYMYLNALYFAALYEGWALYGSAPVVPRTNFVHGITYCT